MVCKLNSHIILSFVYWAYRDRGLYYSELHEFNSWVIINFSGRKVIFYIYGLSLVFVKQLLDNLFYLVLYFLYLSLLSLDYLVKRFILLDFTFFSFYDYYVCFINLQKFPKCYSWIIFKLIFLYLINFGADFCWLITTKGCSACWL